MKHIFTGLLLLLFVLNCFTQEIIIGEYFFNTDPGYGNGTEITFEINDKVDFELTIPFNEDLPVGTNKLYFRFKNEKNVWSHNYSRIVLNEGDLETTQQYGEYYFNTDPGYGNGTEITFESNDTIGFELNIPYTKDLPVGANKLYFRFKNDLNVWSHAYPRIVLNEGSIDDSKQINEVKYYIDTVNLTNEHQLSFKDDSINVSIDTTIDLSDLENGVHYLYLQAKNKNNSQSLLTRRLILVSPESDKNEIESISYYFSTESTVSDVMTYEFSIPAETIDQKIFLDNYDFVEDAIYTMHVIANDSWNNQSFGAKTSFTFGYNQAPYALVPEISVTGETTSSYAFSMDSLFNDNDLPDDSLSYWVTDNLNTNILDVLTWEGDKLIINPSAENAGNHSITLIARDVYGEKDSLQLNLDLQTVSNINNNLLTNKFQLYPNPTSGMVNILFKENAQYNYQLFNSVGVLIYSGKHGKGNHQLDLTSLPKGVYYLKLQAGDTFSYIQIIRK